MKLGRYAARTDPGRKRRGNEDSYVTRPPLFAIADGMGGARAGEVASALAAGALEESGAGRRRRGARRRADPGGEPPRARARLDRRRDLRDGNDDHRRLIESDGTVTMGHVGDSRAYLLRGERLEQLTDDHSLVAELVRRGELSPQAAEVHPQRSVITRALGTDPDVDVDAFSVDAQPGDIFLICSDGLSDMVDGEQIEAIVKTHRGDLDAAAKALVAGREPRRRRGQHHGDPLRARRRRAGRPASRTSAPGSIAHAARRRGHAAPRGRRRAPAARGRQRGMRRPTRWSWPPPTSTRRVAAQELPEPPQAGIGRRLLALAVIVALLAVIVVLVWWGLAR